MCGIVPPPSAGASNVAQGPSRISGQWDAQTEVAESTAATIASPTVLEHRAARDVYPIDEKSPVGSYPSHSPSVVSSTPFFVSSPSSPSAHHLLSPLSPYTVASPASTLPYAWDQPPPGSEFLARRPSAASTSPLIADIGAPARESYQTVLSTPPYSSEGPEVHGRPPSYSQC